MAKVRGRNTQPEMKVRRIAHALGRRFRLYRKDLPGRPDIVFPRLRKIILVHGCFWHRHDCKKATTPKSNVEFWNNKFDENVKRDMNNIRDLKALGWDTMIVWECETVVHQDLVTKVQRFLQVRP